ncbi:MAG: type II toxin-antitoxin system VapC family toxin [Candidatus Dadabacteria bacterium]|nr:MAG: type II toxin-antitoxin system VapC family toxin [Candidatus Dadabacteria bacterium]
MIVLDTHAWIWWAAERDRLSRRAYAAIDGAKEIALPAIACWELAMLVAKGRLRLDRDVLTWVRQAVNLPKLSLVPLLPEISVSAATLPDFRGDPADRMIAATTVYLGGILVTKDQRLRRCRHVQTLW